MIVLVILATSLQGHTELYSEKEGENKKPYISDSTGSTDRGDC